MAWAALCPAARAGAHLLRMKWRLPRSACSACAVWMLLIRPYRLCVLYCSVPAATPT